ncbi:MAG: STAS domain-containing protein [Planctomycetota bacterium]
MPVQRWSDSIWMLALSREPELTEDLDNLDAALRKQSRTPDVVIDLSGVPSVTSSTLARLLKLRSNLADESAQLVLTSPVDRVWTVFITAGLDKVFRFREDTATALAELQLPR